MHALVLAAGLGTRLRPLTAILAKPALPVAGEPMIRRIVGWLASSGVTDLVVNLHHLPQTLTSVLGDGSDLGARVRYSWEQPRILGNAGGPRRALPMLGTNPFLVVNGDTLTDLDLGGLAAAHAGAGALVTLALVPNTEPERYGGVCLDGQGRVSGFVRRGVAAAGSFHFLGVQAVSPEAFRSLPDGQPANSIGGLYDDLLATRPGAIGGFISNAAFWDIGTPSDYLRTSLDFAYGDPRATAGRNLRASPTATVRDSVIWDDVTLGDGCRLDRCIVTDGVYVAAGAVYRDAILIHSTGGPPVTSPIDGPS